MGSPLERELQGQVVDESEPLSERVRVLFKTYEQVRQRVLQEKRKKAKYQSRRHTLSAPASLEAMVLEKWPH